MLRELNVLALDFMSQWLKNWPNKLFAILPVYSKLALKEISIK